MTSSCPLFAGTLIGNAWRPTESGLLGISGAQPRPPLLQSGKRLVLYRLVTVSSGTKEVVQLKIVRTNMRFLPREIVPQSLRGIAVVDVPHQEHNLPKGKARRNVFSGNRDDVKGVPSASFPMMVHQVSRDKLRLPDQHPVAERARSRPEALVERNRTALVDPRVLKDPDHPKETKVQVPARQLLLPYA